MADHPVPNWTPGLTLCAMALPGSYEPRTQPLGAPVAPRPPRRRTGLIVVGILAALVVVFGGITAIVLGTRPTGMKPVAAASPTCDVIGISGCTTKQGNGGGGVVQTPAAPAAPADPAGQEACDAIKLVAGNQTARIAEVNLQPIVDAGSRSTDFDVSFQSKMLGDVWQLAKAAGPSDLAANLNLFTAVLKLETACIKGGYGT